MIALTTTDCADVASVLLDDLGMCSCADCLTVDHWVLGLVFAVVFDSEWASA